jgi:hypothetical protein
MVSRARKPYVVSLAARGNPDFGQAAHLPGVRARKVRAADFGDASRACRDYIGEHDLGSGNWAGGDVRDHTGALVARVSYNGKVWPPGPWAPNLEPLWG